MRNLKYLAAAAVAAGGLAIVPASLAAQDAGTPPEIRHEGHVTTAPPTTAPVAPGQTPSPTLDTDGDGKPDAWDTTGDGRANLWDLDGDGEPDAADTDGDGRPDQYRTGFEAPAAGVGSVEEPAEPPR
ncbi:VCBS repeat-containing protein [Porphyrobacter sp. GA68]|uniref:FG-GAP repeat domain-containing protein n=1 Tax=Porphyrobacter sp. GA68 TaxID=2883480 RepID=UPI001D186558|nr:VCBS repeat-containing protein [Porphyrobacter sp. GA68]